MAITQLPTPPSRADAEATFVSRSNAFLGALPAFATEANALAVEVDADRVAAAASAAEAAASATAATTNGAAQVTLATAQVALATTQAVRAETAADSAFGAVNYQGDYNAGTTYQIGQTVTFDNKTWLAKTVNLGVAPVSGANWLLVNTGIAIGTVLLFPQAFNPGPSWLLASGGIVSQAAYPSLFAAVGFRPVRFTASSVALPTPAGVNVISPTRYSDELLVYTADNTVASNAKPMRSLDNGVTWQTSTGNCNSGIVPVAGNVQKGDGYYLAVTRRNDNVTYITRSTDFNTWTYTANHINARNPTEEFGPYLTHDGGSLWLLVGHDTGFLMRSSDAGVTFVNLADPGAPFNLAAVQIVFACYFAGAFIIGTVSGLLRSVDLVTWTNINPFGISNLNFGIGGGRMLVSTSSVLRSSVDGINWTIVTPFGAGSSFNGMRYINGRWFILTRSSALGADVKMFTSTDGLVFTPIRLIGIGTELPQPVVGGLLSDGSVYYSTVVGTANSEYVSVDGLNWFYAGTFQTLLSNNPVTQGYGFDGEKAVAITGSQPNYFVTTHALFPYNRASDFALPDINNFGNVALSGVRGYVRATL